MYQSEKEFLENYRVSDFKQLSMTSDLLIISISDEEKNDYRKNNGKKMSILLVKRTDYPYKDMWCLPGGFVNPDTETLEDCAKRVLKNETNVQNIYLEQLYTFDGIKRDPRCRVVTTAYIALIDKNILKEPLLKNASWFDVIIYEEKDNIVNMTLSNGIDNLHFSIKKTLRPLSTDRYNFTVLENKDLAFDNPLVILSGIERIRNKITYTDIVFNMMPEYFTLGELQKVYEVILGKKLLDPAFRRMIKNKVVKTDKIKNDGGHRPSWLFKKK